MFNDSKLDFIYSDNPTQLSLKWLDSIVPVFKSIMLASSKEIGISEIVKAISIEEQISVDYKIDGFRAQIEVDFNTVYLFG